MKLICRMWKYESLSRFILISCIALSVLGNNTEKTSSVDEQAWNAITNKFYSDVRGQLLYRMKDQLRDEPITTNLVQNGCLSAIISKARIYQTGIINVRNNFIREKASLVVDENRFTFIESDEAAVSFLNSNRSQNVFSTVRAVQEVLAFGELRGYAIMDEEKLQYLKLSLSDKSKMSDWSFSVREGKEETHVEVTYVTMHTQNTVLWSSRFVFKFRKDGQMILDKVEDSGSVGGFM